MWRKVILNPSNFYDQLFKQYHMRGSATVLNISAKNNHSLVDIQYNTMSSSVIAHLYNSSASDIY